MEQKLITLKLNDMTITVTPENSVVVYVNKRGEVVKTVISKNIADTLLAQVDDVEILKGKKGN
jgi:hypothetical protein